jgi:hypothetical protein
MTTADLPPDSSPGRGGQAHTLRLQSLVNVLTRGLMRIPLVSQGIGRKLVTLYVTGRTSGREYAIPVAYTPHEGRLLVGTPFPWVKNLSTGSAVQVLYRGSRRTADVEVVDAEDQVVRYYSVMCRANRAFANFNRIELGPDGNPNPADLHAAWRSGGRAILLKLR